MPSQQFIVEYSATYYVVYTVNSDAYKLTQKDYGSVVIVQTGVLIETLQSLGLCTRSPRLSCSSRHFRPLTLSVF